MEKTTTGYKVTKKEIQRVLRTMDSTQIYRLHKKMFGNVYKAKIVDFIEAYAPTNKIARYAYKLAYNTKHAEDRVTIECYCMRKHGIYEGDVKHNIIAELKRNIACATSPYAKRPVLGHTNLYFCSPVYGHSDYNKWRACPIKGNEKFVNLVIKVADKTFNKIYK